MIDTGDSTCWILLVSSLSVVQVGRGLRPLLTWLLSAWRLISSMVRVESLGGLSLTSRHVWGFARTYHEFTIFSQSRANPEACLYAKWIRSERDVTQDGKIYGNHNGKHHVAGVSLRLISRSWEDFGWPQCPWRVHMGGLWWTPKGLIKSWASAKHCEIGYLLLTTDLVFVARFCAIKWWLFSYPFVREVWKK